MSEKVIIVKDKNEKICGEIFVKDFSAITQINIKANSCVAIMDAISIEGTKVKNGAYVK